MFLKHHRLPFPSPLTLCVTYAVVGLNTLNLKLHKRNLPNEFDTTNNRLVFCLLSSQSGLTLGFALPHLQRNSEVLPIYDSSGTREWEEA